MIKRFLFSLLVLCAPVAARPALMPAYCGGDCCIAFQSNGDCKISSRKPIKASINCKILRGAPIWSLECEQDTKLEFQLNIESRQAHFLKLINLPDQNCKIGSTVFITRETPTHLQNSSFCNSDCCVVFTYNKSTRQIQPDSWKFSYGPVTYAQPRQCTYETLPGNRLELKWPMGKMQLQQESELIKILSYENFEMPGCEAGEQMIH